MPYNIICVKNMEILPQHQHRKGCFDDIQYRSGPIGRHCAGSSVQGAGGDIRVQDHPGGTAGDRTVGVHIITGTSQAAEG